MIEPVEEMLERVCEKEGIEFEEAEERYEAKLEEYRDKQASAIDEDQLKKSAAKSVFNEAANHRGGYEGEIEEIPMLALGYQFKDSEYFFTDEDALIGLAVVNPDEDAPGLATFVIDSSDGVDLEHAREAFDPLQTTRAFVTRRQVGSRDNEPSVRKGGNQTYVCNTTSKTKFEIVDPEEAPDENPISELPSDHEAKRDLINDNFVLEDDFVDLGNVTDHEATQNANGFAAAFGVDVKRFRGEVLDVYSNDTGFGIMTLLDEDTFEESEVPDQVVGDDQRTAGLQIWMEPNLLRYDEESQLDVYGYIEQSDEGQYRMRAFGAVPIVEYPRDPIEAMDQSEPEDDHEETSI